MDLINDVIERQEKLEGIRERESQLAKADANRAKAKEHDKFDCESLDPRLSGSSSSSNGGSEQLSVIAFRKQTGKSSSRKEHVESDGTVTTPNSDNNKDGSGRDSSSGEREEETKQTKKSRSSSDKSEPVKDVASPKNNKQVKVKLLGLEAWQLTYVRTRNNSLRCFPACRPVHRERSFCGLPIIAVVDAASETEARQMVVLGAFRKVKTDVIQINDKFSTVELTRMLGTDFIIGTLVSYDKKSKQAKFKLGPPRKWRYVANTLSSTELHTFTVYAFTQAGGRCIARQDSPFFTIVPAWRQSATEITARRSDSDSKSLSDSKPLAHPKDMGSLHPAAVPPFHQHLPPYPVFRPQPYEAYRESEESWSHGNMEALSGQRKKRRIPSAHMRASSDYIPPPPPGYFGGPPSMPVRPPIHPRSLPGHAADAPLHPAAVARYPWSTEDYPPQDYNHFDPRWAAPPPPYLPHYGGFYGWGGPHGGEGLSNTSESSSGDDAASTGSSKSSDKDQSKAKKRKEWPKRMMPPQNLAYETAYNGQPPHPPYMSGQYYPQLGQHPFPPSYPPMKYPANEFSKRN